MESFESNIENDGDKRSNLIETKIEIDQTTESSSLKNNNNNNNNVHSSQKMLADSDQADVGLRPNQFKITFYQTLRKCVWLFPLSLVILIPMCCLIPYFMALHFAHLAPIFPYVSDGGGKSPQAGYFSQLIDLISISIFITGFCRYKMLKYIIHLKHSKSGKISQETLIHLDRCNFASSILVYLSAFGSIVIGNFRVTEIVFFHFFGTSICFAFMLAYASFQVYISYHLSKWDKNESTPYTMLIITLFAGLSLIICLIGSFISIIQAGYYQFFNDDFRLHWNSDQNGYLAHLVGTIGEWCAINSISPFYLCLFNRMKRFNEWDKVKF